MNPTLLNPVGGVAAFSEMAAMIADLERLAERSDAVLRCLTACRSGIFEGRDGGSVAVETRSYSDDQLALLAHLASHCPTPLSVEIGFGMGLSAMLLLGARSSRQTPFQHLIFDPYGLGHGQAARIERYLDDEFGPAFKRIHKPSQIALGQLLDVVGPGSAGLVFIDGSHRFENIMMDFALADEICCQGGHLVFDDAWYPAIEAALNYIATNRPDYALAARAAPNTAVLRKVGEDRRDWCSFQPFSSPSRVDWTPHPEAAWPMPSRP